MSEHEFQKIEKLLFYSRSKNHISIKNNDLQINITVKEAIQMKSKISFQKVYSQFLHGAKSGQPTALQIEREDLKIAMEEAKTAYDSMMQIHKQLNKAYKEFIQMQS